MDEAGRASRSHLFAEGRVAMGEKVLVTYASKKGSTAEIAEEIGRTLSEAHGASVTVRPLVEVAEVDGYDAVIIGSAIRGDRLLPPVINFVVRHRAALSKLPVAYFVVCMTMREETEKSRRTALGFLDPLLRAVPEVEPVAVGLFAGALDSRGFPPLTRAMMRLARTPRGDFRDWEVIREWARGLPWRTEYVTPV
jgi:menaquinone-dependent protoporphyrinogen oxidase